MVLRVLCHIQENAVEDGSAAVRLLSRVVITYMLELVTLQLHLHWNCLLPMGSH